VHPPLSSTSAGGGNRLVVDEEPKQVREIYSGATAQRVPAPNARIDVEKLEFAIAGILLELDLDKSGEPRGRQ